MRVISLLSLPLLLNAMAGCLFIDDATHAVISDRDGDTHLSVDAGGDDCDDAVATVFPGAVELCNGRDDNCDGTIDEGLEQYTMYADGDGDGFGALETATVACLWDPDLVADGSDCDDNNADAFPGRAEVCDNVDNDCNELIDDDAANMRSWYADRDEDGFGNALDSITTCDQTAPDGFVADGSDCEDANPNVHPDAIDVCNDVDDNCNVDVDEHAPNWYVDADADGFGAGPIVETGCNRPGDLVDDDGDCDDGDISVHPGADEQCDVDANCDGLIDQNAIGEVMFADADGDGFGDPAVSESRCPGEAGWVFVDTDCNDADSEIRPGWPEVCDGNDTNCDGVIDNDPATGGDSYFLDRDLDGYGDPNRTGVACAPVPGLVEDNTDCDDNTALINPAAAEICDNAIDDNCGASASACGLDDGDLRLLTANYVGLEGARLATRMVTGDFNGDGNIDLAVSSHRSQGVRSNDGRVDLFLGPIDWDSMGVPNVTIHGLINDELGRTMGSAGDLNGDGFDDLVIGSLTRSVSAVYGGQVWLLEGQQQIPDESYLISSLAKTVHSKSFEDYYGLTIGAGFSMTGADTPNVFVTAHRYSSSAVVGHGEVYLYDQGFTDATRVTLQGAVNGDDFGRGAAAMDLTGDGEAEMMVGAPLWQNSSSDRVGVVAVFEPGGNRGFDDANRRFAGEEAGDYLGSSVHALGDLDGDGLGDWAVAARQAFNTQDNSGKIYLMNGLPDATTGTIESRAENVVSCEANPIGSDPFCGFQVAGVDDVNGDGRNDLLITMAHAQGTGSLNAGRLSVIFGPITGPVDLGAANNPQVATIKGPDGGKFGTSIGLLGDIDGDSMADFLVGAPLSNGNRGSIWLFRGEGL